MPIPRKGLRDIPTHRARKQTDLPPYSIYMRIACIEMEKGRRGMEQLAARRRMDHAESRLRDLECEKTELLSAVENDSAPPSLAASGGFRIHY